ncbi:A disintegrin and metalloproteinase with thrombospondin motifs 3-like isoform X2 [Bombus affinis]|uniref:A disintegrin and metalloproteinase with thrombospondin motifs 3-like isoform X2 n=1 Tax=Bombus affinis TaxID=309941 RepID=UPI0021B7987A|nr:A disintegrin and metalloproteinase with thrombospondin motifs 3-like isoform X2 [Bombus affinis]
MDPSLESNMILVIVRMILYAGKRDVMVRRGDARRSLENVNKWNRKMLSSKGVNLDVAVWLTRLDIGGPSGYAPVSGVCDPARSCALNRDEGLTSAFIIAHEVAHITKLILWSETFSFSFLRDKGEVFGSAIEKMLTAEKGNDTGASGSSGKPSVSPNKPMSGKVTNWFSNTKNQNRNQTESSEPSLCSSLKDLFKK